MSTFFYRLGSLVLLGALALVIGTPLVHLLHGSMATGYLVFLLLLAIVGGSMLLVG